jgi:hypothetical protein
MVTIPLASFLAGSLISLLIPIGVLIALVAWYMTSVLRVPEDTAAHAPHAGPGGESEPSVTAPEPGAPATGA